MVEQRKDTLPLAKSKTTPWNKTKAFEIRMSRLPNCLSICPCNYRGKKDSFFLSNPFFFLFKHLKPTEVSTDKTGRWVLHSSVHFSSRMAPNFQIWSSYFFLIEFLEILRLIMAKFEETKMNMQNWSWIISNLMENESTGNGNKYSAVVIQILRKLGGTTPLHLLFETLHVFLVVLSGTTGENLEGKRKTLNTLGCVWY